MRDALRLVEDKLDPREIAKALKTTSTEKPQLCGLSQGVCRLLPFPKVPNLRQKRRKREHVVEADTSRAQAAELRLF